MPSKPVPARVAKPASPAAASPTRRAALRRGGVGQVPLAPGAARPAPARPAAKATLPAAKPISRAKPAKPAKKGAMPKADAALITRMDGLMAAFPAYRRPMFGTVSWFLDANAQMFTGLWGDAVTARVGEAEAQRLVAAGRAQPFEPVPGRPMREYVLVPASTLRDGDLKKWIARAADFTSGLGVKTGR